MTHFKLLRIKIGPRSQKFSVRCGVVFREKMSIPRALKRIFSILRNICGNKKRKAMKEDPFISVLIEKLNKVKRDQEVRAKLEKTLQLFCAYGAQKPQNAVKLKQAKAVHWEDNMRSEKRKIISPLSEAKGKSKTKDSSLPQTVVGYCFGLNSVPFMTRVAGRRITLAHFKILFNRKGCYRYFFKKYSNEFGTNIVFEEIIKDEEVLPLWDNKIFAIVEEVDSYKL